MQRTTTEMRPPVQAAHVANDEFIKTATDRAFSCASQAMFVANGAIDLIPRLTACPVGSRVMPIL